MDFLEKKKALGAKLQAKRKEKGLTFYAVRKTGIIQPQVEAMESGEGNYTINILLRYANLLGIKNITL